MAIKFCDNWHRCMPIKTKFTTLNMTDLCLDITRYFSFIIIVPKILCLFMDNRKMRTIGRFHLVITNGDDWGAKKAFRWDGNALRAPKVITNCG